MSNPQFKPPHRLLHVFPGFGVGGAQMRFATLVGPLGRDFAHTVISLNGSAEAMTITPPEARVGLTAAPSGAGNLLGRVRRFAATIREQRPNLVLTYNWGAIEWALAARLAGVPHVHHEDGFGPEEADRQFLRRIWMRRIALSRSHVVVPSTTLEVLAARVWKLAPASVHHIPNGIAPLHAPATSISELGVPLDDPRPIIAWVGALRPEKNPSRLLQAFAPLARSARLVVIGDGPERASLEAKVRSMNMGQSVQFLGMRTDARDLLMQCDLLALSSDTEQMPYVVLEAMDAALPVAAVDVGDVARMVSQDNRPFIGGRTAERLSAALATLIARPDLRVTIGAANRARRRAVYDIETMAARYRTLFVGLSSAAAGAVTSSVQETHQEPRHAAPR